MYCLNAKVLSIYQFFSGSAFKMHKYRLAGNIVQPVEKRNNNESLSATVRDHIPQAHLSSKTKHSIIV